jgi:hypothetical protein
VVLTKKTGDMKLFLNDLDDLHQWDFMRNQQMVREVNARRAGLRPYPVVSAWASPAIIRCRS